MIKTATDLRENTFAENSISSKLCFNDKLFANEIALLKDCIGKFMFTIQYEILEKCTKAFKETPTEQGKGFETRARNNNL